MARRRTKICSVSGCSTIVSGANGKCATHRRKADKERDKRTGRVRGARWTSIRRQVLREQPFCRDSRTCGGKAISVEVDHVTPLAFGGHPTSRDNLQGICRKCHDAKTRDEQKRLGAHGGGLPE